jgi:hypothetical protein
MSDFKTGDRITVADSLTPDKPRYFLAELDGWLYYRTGDGSVGQREAWGTDPGDVSAYVPPFPFKVGDRIRQRKAGSILSGIVYTVMAVEGDMVHLAFYDRGIVKPAASEVRCADTWELATDPAKPPALRDRYGVMWRPTGRTSESGEAYYSTWGNVENKTTRRSLLARSFGPLTEVTV